MTKQGSVVIEIDADDSRFKKGLKTLKSVAKESFYNVERDAKTAKNAIQDIAKKAKETASKLKPLGSALKNIGSIAGASFKAVAVGAAAASTALTAAGGAALKFGMDYETSLAKVSTIADTSVKSIDRLSDEVIAISNETGASAKEINEALYSAISAGADTAHATDLVAVAVKAAKGGFTDTETAVDGLTTAMNTYGMATTEAGSLANKFLITQNLGKTTFGELSNSIGMVAPTAKAAGVSIDELLSSAAALTANGIATSEAMTGMKATLSNIIKPTAEAQKAAKELGIDFSVAALQSKGWIGFLEEIKEKTGGDTEVMGRLFGSTEALNTMLTLTADNGMALVNETMSEMATNTTALDNAFGKMDNTLGSTMGKINTNLQNLGISVYQSLKEPLNETANTALTMVQGLQSAFDEGGLSGLVSALGYVVAEAIAGIAEYAPQMVEAAVSLIQSLAKGLLLKAHDIAKSAAEIVKSLVKGIVDLFPTILETGGEMVISLAQGLVATIPELIDGAMQMFSDFLDFLIENLPAIIMTGAEMLGALARGIIRNIPKLVAQLPKIITAIAEGIMALMSGLLDIGFRMVQGIWEGISNSAKWLLGKVKEWCGNILAGIKAFFGIHSPSRVMNTEVGKMLVLGVANGISENSKKTKAAIVELSKIMLSTAKKRNENYEEIGEDMVEMLTQGIEKKKNDAISAMESLVDKEFAAYKNQSGKLTGAYKEAADLLTKTYKEALENGYDEAETVIRERMEAISKVYQSQYEEIKKQQEDLEKTLSGGFGDLFTIEEGFVKLEDLDDSLRQIQSYNDALTELKEEYGATDDFLAEITGLGAEEGLAVAKRLLRMSKNSFGAYQEKWLEKQRLARQVASAFYADQLNTLDENFNKELNGALSDIPDQLETIGKQSMKGWINGMNEELPNLEEAAREISRGVVAAIQDEMDIHSPSHVMETDVGEPSALGVGVGFEKAYPKVMEDMRQAVAAETARMSHKLETATSGGNGGMPIREINNYTKVIEKAVLAEPTGDFGELIRLLRLKIREEDKRVGANLVGV